MTDTDTTTAVAKTEAPRNELRLAGPRLPYHPAIEERFNIDRGAWKVLTDTIFPAAEAPESILMALSYCRARNLDIFKKPVHIVPVWDKKRGKMVDSVWPAIAEVRITAMRTREYAGKDETAYGPDVTETLGGVEITYPKWAQVTVYRLIGGQRCAFVGEKLLWKEYYAKAKRDTLAPNDMWKTKTYHQLAKCAEADALRAAFPEEAGGDATSDEMAGQEVATVASGESLTGTGVMARLTSNSTGAAEGFNGANIEGALAGDDAPKEPTPPKSTRAKREKAKPDPVEPEPVIDVEAVEAVLDEMVDEALAEIEEVFPGDKNPEQEAIDRHTASGGTGVVDAETGEVTGDGPEDDDEAEDISEGHAAPDEVYMLAADGWEEDDKTPTYKNGEPYSRVGAKGAAALNIYRDHPPVSVMQDATKAEPVQEAAPEAEPPATEDEVEDDEIDLFVQDCSSATSWLQIKAKLGAMQKLDVWKNADPARLSEVRAQLWDMVVALKETRGDPVDFACDPSAFRLWLETQSGPDGADAVEGNLRVLRSEPIFLKMPEDSQRNFVAIVEAAMKNMRG